MIAIIMTYFNRQSQLNKTLESFLQYDPKEFIVVVVDDGSAEDINKPSYPFDVTILKLENKTWFNSCVAFNTGIYYAMLKRPEIIILQNAECYHIGDILNYVKKIDNETYISFGCYSQGETQATLSVLNNRCATFGGDSAWYNHPVYRPVGYHFCSAITYENLIMINGFDERLAFGIGYEDDYLLHQIKCLGLRVEITAEPIVIHQWHKQMYGNDYTENGKIYKDLIKENNYRAEHLLTPNL